MVISHYQLNVMNIVIESARQNTINIDFEPKLCVLKMILV